MISPRPDDLPPEWLAAYADGELTELERLRVQRWLAQNGEVRELLDAQESLGPGNDEFWQAVRPPEPTPQQWTDASNRIRQAAPPAPRRNWTGWLGTIGLLATAASLLLILFNSEPRLQDEAPAVATQPGATPLIDEPYQMASSNEVRIISLPESAASLLMVGEHPLQNLAMRFARFGEIEFYGIGSDLAGRFPEMPNDPLAEEIPVIWAPR